MACFDAISVHCSRKTDSVVVTIEDGVIFAHEDVTDEEHVLLNVHVHQGRATDLLHLSISGSRSVMLLLALSLKLNVGLRSRTLELSHDLRTERSHAEGRLHTTLSEAKRFRIEHPFIGGERIILAVDNESKITEIVLALALNEVGRSR